MIKGDGLLPSFFNLTLASTIRKVLENQMGLKLNGAHQLLVFGDVNPVGYYTNKINKNIETVPDNNKKVGLEVNTEKTKYIHAHDQSQECWEKP
jgi:hypothetical protein